MMYSIKSCFPIRIMSLLIALTEKPYNYDSIFIALKEHEIAYFALIMHWKYIWHHKIALDWYTLCHLTIDSIKYLMKYFDTINE